MDQPLKNKKRTFKSNKKTNKNETLREKRLRETSQAAKLAKKKSQEITLNFIECELTTSKLLQENIKYITIEQYDDIVDERSIGKVCGYPLCCQVLLQNDKNNNFIIRNNNVYDITDRKKFCSNKCYECSELIKKQIPSTPLYLRENDEDIQNFTLKIPKRLRVKGRYGKKVNIKGSCFEYEDTFADSSGSENEDEVEKSDSEESSNELDHKTANKDSSSDELESDTSDPSDLGLDRLQIQDKENSVANNKKTATATTASRCPLDLKQQIIEVELIMREWITFESLRIILGDNYVRGMLEQLGETWEDYDTTAGLRMGIESKSKYVSLCKKIDRQEVADEREAHLSDSDTHDEKNCHSVPDLNRLQQDLENQSLKVNAFYEGSLEYTKKDTEDALPTIQEEENEQSKSKKKIGKTNKNKSRPTVEESSSFPLVDLYEQNTWRRHIFLEKVRKSFSTLCCDLSLDEGQFRRILKPLIATFDLSSQNIVLRTSQWHFTAIVLLKLFSVRYPIVQEVLNNDFGRPYMFSLMTNFGLDSGYLDRLLSYLTEIKYILTKYHQERKEVSNPVVAQVSDQCEVVTKENHHEVDTLANQTNKENSLAKEHSQEDNRSYYNYEELD